MTAYLRHPLTIVWALLTVVTVASWLTARDSGDVHHADTTVTMVVLLSAAIKTQLVIWHFMEVRHAPRWVKLTTNGWLIGLFSLLLGFYFVVA